VSGQAVHDVLIIEDHAPTAKKLADFVRSRGERPHVATCVRQALEMLREIDPCYVLADHELPMEEGDDPFPESGEYLLRQARQWDMRVVPGTLLTVLQIIVVTGLPAKSKFVARVLHLGASHFQEKPLGREQLRELSQSIDECLARARRADHAACAQHARAEAPPEAAAAAAPSPKPTPTPTPAKASAPAPSAAPRVRIDGTREGARMVVYVDGHKKTMQENAFVSLLRAIVVHQRSRDAYADKGYLRIRPGGSATTRMREPFKGLVPDGFEVLERGAAGQLRLNPAIVVEHVDWLVLAESPNDHIRKTAVEQCDRLRLRA
jgi:CheY-like chemotaxis protein